MPPVDTAKGDYRGWYWICSITTAEALDESWDSAIFSWALAEELETPR